MTQSKKLEQALQIVRKKLAGETHTAYLNRVYKAEVMVLLSNSSVLIGER